MSDFAQTLIRWQRTHGRHDLPWQACRDPYRIWISEIMLQQTQVDTVIPYYRRFLARFATIDALAGAKLEEVLALWSGLGYYARARNVHACARILVAEHDGRFPALAEEIARLPGIGRSTAAAIAVFAFGARAAILDGNVKRVLCRHFGITGDPASSRVLAELWSRAESLLPAARVDVYVQAQMDLGATVCLRTRPHCGRCPLHDSCTARREGRTAELPSRRTRPPRPQRHRQMLVLRAADRRVLLEQRPAAGLWGGMLVLPDYDGEIDELAGWLAPRYGLRPSAVLALPPLRHAFTHFTLQISPWLVDVEETSRRLGESTARWADASSLDALPLPAPVRRILEGLAALNPLPAACAGAGRSG
ncbi:MAG: A/G-specific adenine glycosylase [Rhodocyclaceae bacterium]|nr:A/G-specific adenine glycosylase [Rhodocyclaceae bacterium]